MSDTKNSFVWFSALDDNLIFSIEYSVKETHNGEQNITLVTSRSILHDRGVKKEYRAQQRVTKSEIQISKLSKEKIINQLKADNAVQLAAVARYLAS